MTFDYFRRIDNFLGPQLSVLASDIRDQYARRPSRLARVLLLFTCSTLLKASFSFHKITVETLIWLPYILICHYTLLSPWFIILDKNNFVNVSYHYWIPIWTLMYNMLKWRSGGVFSHENTPEGCTETHKSLFLLYKEVSRRNSDHECLRMTNAFILSDLLWNSSEKSCSEQRR